MVAGVKFREEIQICEKATNMERGKTTALKACLQVCFEVLKWTHLAAL